MKLLITGASGFIGQQVIALAQQQGIEVVALGRHYPETFSARAFISADLLDEKISAAQLSAQIQPHQPTHLLHLAWVTEHGAYWQSPLNLAWVSASERLAQAFCMSGGQQVVGVGSCAEYDWCHMPCVEDDTPLQAATLYGRAKGEAYARMAKVCAQFEVGCAWARVFLLYGAGEDSRRLLPSIIGSLTNQPSQLTSDHASSNPLTIGLSLQRDLLHVHDVAQALLHLLQTKARGAFNVCSGEPVSLRQLVQQTARLLAANPSALLARSRLPRADEPISLYGENRRLRALGWAPQCNLQQGLAQVIAAQAEAFAGLTS